jgi:Spy/CpxP family protein refolding chaperone
MSKRTLLTLALSVVVLFSTAAFAQGAQPAKGQGHRGGHGEFAGVNLTTDQRAQIRSIHQEARTKMENLASQKLTRAEFRSQAGAIRQDAHTKSLNVLTPDQRAQVEQRQQQRQQRFHKAPPSSN